MFRHTKTAAALFAGLALQTAQAAPNTSRVQAGDTQPNAASGVPAVSANGKVVAFASAATNLVRRAPESDSARVRGGRRQAWGGQRVSPSCQRRTV